MPISKPSSLNHCPTRTSETFTFIELLTAKCLLCLALFFLATPETIAQSSRPGMGSIPYEGGVTFRVWAPNASSVTVRGDFNGFGQNVLVSEGNGNWSNDVPGALVGQQYQYFLNGSLWKRDPRARRVINSVGNSIIYDAHAFNWGETPIPKPWRNDFVIYQMHLGTFSGPPLVGTFDRAIQRLDHIQELGVNVIKLLPVNEFSGDYSWGYNPSDPFAIESAYGGPEAFKRFVRAAHERGIAVFMDVVHNHYGPSDLDMWRFDGWFENSLGGIYFYNDARAHTPWGSTRPDFGRSQVRQFIRDQIFMFVEEYRVGGFRWDSVVNIINDDTGQNVAGRNMLTSINNELALTHPHVERGAEDHAFDFNMNFQNVWDVGWRWNLHGQVTAASDANRNMNTVKDLLDGWPSHNRVVFSEAHDYIAKNHGRSRIPTEIDGSNPESAFARKRALLAAGIVMTTPGIPMIFQGQEMHETQAFHDDTGLRWDRATTHAGIVDAYTDLIHARRNLRGGTQGLKGTGVNVHHIDNTNKVIAYVRWDAGGQTDDVVVVANFSNTTWNSNNYSIPFPSTGTWYSHFNSDARIYQSDFGDVGPTEVTASGASPSAPVNMGPYSLQIFSKQPTATPPTAASVNFDPAAPVGCVPVTITYDATGRVLDGASQVFIHIGRNGWQNVILPNPEMTWMGGELWEYTYTMPGQTTELNMVFNDGAGTWDNNNEQNWALWITGCGEIEAGPPATIVFSTPERTVTQNLTSDLITVQLRDALSQVTTSEGTTLVSLSSNHPGTFRDAEDTANITSVTIGDGQSSASFRYTSDILETHVLTASHPGLTGATQNLTVSSSTLGSRLYTDTTGDVFTTAGSGILDITSVEVSHSTTDLLFKITVAGNPSSPDWGKYMIGFDTAPGGSTTSNGWGRPISMSSGMDHWVGTWVDGGNGGEVWTWTGTAWNRQSATYGENPDNIGVTKDTTTVYIQFGFSGLGLSLGDSFSFDVYASGGGGGDSAIDSLANPNQTISDWGQAYDSGSILVEYTLTEDSSDPWLTDSNEDGIPDGWYLQFGFDPEGPSIAEIDTDGDGFTNRQEFLLGTNPTDPNSRFRIVSFDFDGEGLPRLTWTSVGGRTYSVEYTNDLILGFTEAAVVVEDAVADGVETTRTFVDDTSTSGGPTDTGRRTYRVQLVLE